MLDYIAKTKYLAIDETIVSYYITGKVRKSFNLLHQKNKDFTNIGEIFFYVLPIHSPYTLLFSATWSFMARLSHRIKYAGKVAAVRIILIIIT